MEEKWTKSQKVHARELFDLALEREYAALIKQINVYTYCRDGVVASQTNLRNFHGL